VFAAPGQFTVIPRHAADHHLPSMPTRARRFALPPILVQTEGFLGVENGRACLHNRLHASTRKRERHGDNNAQPMKVLLIATDLYHNIGGGQTVYRRLVESAPGVDFFYFRQDESHDSPRPRNATAIPLSIRLKLKALGAPPYPAFRLSHLQDADRFARSVAGRQFDIVDTPDFFAFGSLLRDAFAHHRVTVGRIVLAMHGNISVSLEMAWGSAGDNVLEQRMLEREQFETADGAYAISPRYIREWQSRVNRPVHYIDPLAFVDIPDSVRFHRSIAGKKPDLYCIGRTERRKGNDLFVELVRWIDPALYGNAAHVGDELVAPWGAGTRAILFDIAEKRGAAIGYFPSHSREKLRALFQESCLVILPVRYDTLNLIALEALFAGCPVAVSSEAGVCDYLDSTHPGLPYIKLDFANFYGAVSPISELLARYDEARDELRAYLSTLDVRARRPVDMRTIYENIAASPSSAICKPRPIVSYFESGQTTLARAAGRAKRVLPIETYRAAKRLFRRRREDLLTMLRESEYFGDARYLGALTDARHVPARLKRIAQHSEYNKSRLREKLNEIYGACTNPLYRCNFWLDIARIERILGNELVAVTYELRALRLVGSDQFGVLPRVVSTLTAEGFKLEASAAEALYGAPAGRPDSVFAFLKERYADNRQKHASAYEHVDDRRRGSPKVAVIVSLYKAAAKLHGFLTTMSHQTLVRQGAVEFILVDSGSPDCEMQVIQQFWRETPISAVYARSERRETIQAAWNRGVLLSNAPYLVFLGVDETLYPEAIEALARELDKDPTVDWVMANSLVTAVDQHGVYKNDIMTYDRSQGTKDHAYLETCYLSWVGGMYRRSIHERFGFYDESFGASGDTEFKNRVLPHISVKFIPRALGLFLNYPDERTTASPRAEIEDLRAWYIHRTPGGIRYAFDDRDFEEVERLLYAALGYRKSYCNHVSSDIEYAAFLAQYLSEAGSVVGAVAPDLLELLQLLRRTEFSNRPPASVGCVSRLLTSWRCAARYQRKHRSAFNSVARPTYHILNDNRYEQHSWLWRTT
jgi:glycosyltransferase involved in cell wall biosynthesis